MVSMAGTLYSCCQGGGVVLKQFWWEVSLEKFTHLDKLILLMCSLCLARFFHQDMCPFWNLSCVMYPGCHHIP